jgi:hypothetical protein
MPSLVRLNYSCRNRESHPTGLGPPLALAGREKGLNLSALRSSIRRTLGQNMLSPGCGFNSPQSPVSFARPYAICGC